MRRSIIVKAVAVATIVLAVASWGTLRDLVLSYPLANYPPSRGGVMLWGGAVSGGSGASTSTNSYPSVLAKRLSIEIANLASASSTVQEIEARSAHDLAERSPGIVMLALEGDPTSKDVLATLERIARRVTSSGAFFYVVDLRSTKVAPSIAELAELSARAGILYSPNVLDAGSAVETDEAHLRIADRIAPGLEAVVLAVKTQGD